MTESIVGREPICDCPPKDSKTGGTPNQPAAATPSQVAVNIGTLTTSMMVKFGSTGENESFNEQRTHAGCLSLPLKSGGRLPLRWNFFSGQGLVVHGAGPDSWAPAGRGGVFSFLPYLQKENLGISTQDADLRTGDGTVRMGNLIPQPSGVTYFISQSPFARDAKYLFDTTKYFIYRDLERGTTEFYGGGDHATVPGRVVARIDRSGNVLQYNYRARGNSAHASYFQILKSITGDTSVIPYFFYRTDASNQNEAAWAPIAKIHLVAPQGDHRTMYFEYDSTLTTVTKVINPGGCVVQYQFVGAGAAQEAAILREVDQENYTSYFEYTATGATDYRTVRNTIEPSGRVTYFSYADGRDKVTTNRRSATYYNYDLDQNHLANISRTRDARGNTTYYEYQTVGAEPFEIDRVRVRIRPGNVRTYYRYQPGTWLGASGHYYAMLSKTEELNSAKTEYVYAANKLDVVKMIDPRGGVTYYDYDGNRNRTVVVNPLNNTTRMGRDSSARVCKQQNARSNSTYFNFTAATGFQRSVVDANNKAAYFGYDSYRNVRRMVSSRWQESNFSAFTTYYEYTARDQKRKQIDALGRTSYFNYTSRGDLDLTVNARNIATYYEYTALRQLYRTFVASAAGMPASAQYYEYDAFKNRIGSADPRGNKTYFIYDSMDLLVAVRDAAANRTYFGYDSHNNRMLTRDARANQTYFWYDGIDRLFRTKDGVGNQTYFGYDLSNNRNRIRDPRGNKTDFTFDLLNRVTAVLDAAGQSQSTTYDAVGNVNKIVNQTNQKTYFNYDVLDRVSSVCNNLGFITSYHYNAAGARAKIVDARTNTSYFFYDRLDRPSVNRNALGNAAYFIYDEVGNQTKRRDARGQATYFFYDALNRMNIQRDALGNRTYYGYDAGGNRVKMRDALSHATTLTYDSLNRATQITDALSNNVNFGYDAVGNRYKERDQRSNTTYYSFDAVNRLSGIVDPLNASCSFAYDANSNLHRSVDYRGLTTYFAYDELNRRTRIGYPGYGIQSYGTSHYGQRETQEFEYDAVGGLTRAVGDESTVSFSYDGLERVRRKTSDWTSAYFAYITAGDNGSLLQNLFYPNSVQAYYTYDAANRMQRVIGPSSTGNTTIWARNANGLPVKQRFGSTAVCYYQYDNASQTSRILHVTSAGASIAYFDYQRDADNRITRITREGDLYIEYGYDDVDRLTAETWKKRSTSAQIYAFSYRYDVAGNRNKCHRADNAGAQIDTAYYVFDAANALTKRIALPGNTITYYRYDANGSLTRMLEGSNGTYFEYAGNGFVSKIIPPEGEASAWQFAYDPLLNRRKIVKAGTATYYLWNGMNQLEERNSAGTLTARYTHGPGIVPGVGTVVQAERITATSAYYQYLHMDHQGSVHKVTDSVQTTKISYVNDAFGRQIVAPTQTGANASNDLVFHSNWLTVQIGSRRFGISPTRVYDPEIGRFLQRDPIGSNGGINLYKVYFVPNGLDPRGLAPIDLLFWAPDAPPTTIPGSFPGQPNPGWQGAIADFNDMFSQALNSVKPGDCIRTLELSGHGNERWFSVGPMSSWRQMPGYPGAYVPPEGSASFGDQLDDSNAHDLGKRLSGLPFCCPCVIILSGCHTGNLQGENTWPQAIADATGCSVLTTLGHQRGTFHQGNSRIGQFPHEDAIYNAQHAGDPNVIPSQAGTRTFTPSKRRSCPEAKISICIPKTEDQSPSQSIPANQANF
jgi:RHS repeat-associated protein